ncbi:biopolymer transporter TonB [Sulfuricaulis limicola]|uniref:Biopolymer transporter TonB n=1 Tax=Sulfuricaulis limicola TaxID=1620215 RepID=A0A1B4XIW0_9GAMM|nr:energy transducer TonB [Sulfuricaulis limicola]BAV34724.1 biopolymer transporter TonB [Sulfuricaulis limicola]
MTTQTISGISQADRFGVTMFGSFLVHMVLILGVTFTLPKLRDLPGLPSLEIALVQTSSDKRPQDAEFLAQANQDGGGDSDTQEIAKNPLPVREISPVNRDFPTFQSMPEKRVESLREKTTLLSRNEARKIKQQESQPDKKELQLQPPILGLMTHQEIQEERARLNAEIDRTWQEYQKRPRRKFLNARTQEYKYAVYLEGFRAKVERIGNLNYPAEAKRRSIRGSLQLGVILAPDGSVKTIELIRSSGHKVLDDAAKHIVELSSPFQPFPDDIRSDMDEMHITRTWRFNDTLTSEN